MLSKLVSTLKSAAIYLTPQVDLTKLTALHELSRGPLDYNEDNYHTLEQAIRHNKQRDNWLGQSLYFLRQARLFTQDNVRRLISQAKFAKTLATILRLLDQNGTLTQNNFIRLIKFAEKINDNLQIVEEAGLLTDDYLLFILKNAELIKDIKSSQTTLKKAGLLTEENHLRLIEKVKFAKSIADTLHLLDQVHLVTQDNFSLLMEKAILTKDLAFLIAQYFDRETSTQDDFLALIKEAAKRIQIREDQIAKEHFCMDSSSLFWITAKYASKNVSSEQLLELKLPEDLELAVEAARQFSK